MSDTHQNLVDTLRAHGGAPDHLPGFAAALASALDEVDREMGRSARRPLWRRWRKVLARRRLRLAVATGVTLLLLATATLGAPSGMRLVEGLFDGSRVQQVFLGPETAEAEPVSEVVRIAQRALRSARFVSGDFAVWRGDPGDEPHFVSTVHVVLAADGSRRVTANLDYGAWEVTYDAATGVSRVWSASFGPGHSVRIETEERAVGAPPGEPDGGRSLADFSLPVTNGVGWQLFGSVARIARAGAGGSAATGVFDGRPVWIVTCPVMLRAPGERGAETAAVAGGSDAAERRLSVSVDQRSGLPVRIQSWVGGLLTAELRLQNVKVDGLVADGVFAPGPPRSARVTRGDDGRLALSVDLGTSTATTPLPFDPETVSPRDVRVSIADEPAIAEDPGFRRTSIDEVPAATGRAALVPTWLPGGFSLRCVAVRNGPGSLRESNPLAARASADTGVVMLRYGFGFEAITVTTRRLDLRRAPSLSAPGPDPFIGSSWPGWADARTAVRLTAGAFAGGSCRVVVAPLTIPHLWAVKDGVLLTVAGDASAQELLAIADSIEPLGTTADPQLPAHAPTAE
jgi:hypothetical protein